jgi:hypothetical protein
VRIVIAVLVDRFGMAAAKMPKVAILVAVYRCLMSPTSPDENSRMLSHGANSPTFPNPTAILMSSPD